MLASRPPLPALRPFVRLLWAGLVREDAGAAPWREHVAPTGCMHLVLRPGAPPLRLFAGADDLRGATFGHAVVGGARTGFYVKEAGTPGWSVGAQLEPGSAMALFGVPAGELAERHTLLADLWGREAQSCLDRLQAATTPQACMATLEALLLERLRDAPLLHPAVAAAVAVLAGGGRVQDAVAASRFSHRHLVERYRAAVGLAPKQHARVLRLQTALATLVLPRASFAQVAAEAGYADQAHFTREFGAFTGVTPTEWRLARPLHAHHVPRRGA